MIFIFNLLKPNAFKNQSGINVRMLPVQSKNCILNEQNKRPG